MRDGWVVEDPYGRMSRRRFLTFLCMGWLALGASLALTGAMLKRFFFPNVRGVRKDRFITIRPSDLSPNTVDERFKNAFGVALCRATDPDTGRDIVYALSTTCTHLGCQLSFVADEDKFRCPCHGSTFRRSGIPFEGPAPRPLERYRVTLSPEGRMVVDKSRRFLSERGQWSDPEAFLTI